jgi:hypothetical protein
MTQVKGKLRLGQTLHAPLFQYERFVQNPSRMSDAKDSAIFTYSFLGCRLNPRLRLVIFDNLWGFRLAIEQVCAHYARIDGREPAGFVGY